MHNLTLAEIARNLAEKRFSAEELTRTLLARIEQLDPQLNSFISVTDELAIAQAKAADARRAAGENGALLGAPIGHKDLFCTQGIRTSCGSRILDSFKAPYDATVVERLAAAGTVTLGKLNMDEFAMGSANESSYYGPVKNPWDLSRVPGGSSGGSAAAIAARLLPAATGTDTGGSIRQPASFVGIVGIKPTYGRCSRWGIVSFASSRDQAGPMTRTVADAALMLGSMCGFDPKDSTSVDMPVPDFKAALTGDIRGLKVGIPKEYRVDGMPAEIEKLWQQGIDWLKAAGAELWVADIFDANVKQAMDELGANVVRPQDIYGLDVDVFAPCAMGGILNEQTLEVLRAPVIAGAANNQLASAEIGVELQRRNQLYAPDYAINAGGIIDVYYQRNGGSAAQIDAHVNAIAGTLREIFERAAASGECTSVIADRLALERLQAGGAPQVATLQRQAS